MEFWTNQPLWASLLQLKIEAVLVPEGFCEDWKKLLEHKYWINVSAAICLLIYSLLLCIGLLYKFALCITITGSSVQFSRSVVSDSLRPHEPQYTRPPCPSPTPGVHPNSCPLSRFLPALIDLELKSWDCVLFMSACNNAGKIINCFSGDFLKSTLSSPFPFFFFSLSSHPHLLTKF